MSDDDDDHQSTSGDKHNSTTINRQLQAIKARLHELNREKTKYNLEKLDQDKKFLESEIRELRHTISDANSVINNQAHVKRTLNAEMTNFKSQSRLRWTTLAIAIKEKEKLQRELKKSDKNENYRNLVQETIRGIDADIPKLQKLEEYRSRLKDAEKYQEDARKRRDMFQEFLKTKSSREIEIKQLLSDSENKLPKIECEIASLRAEREKLTGSSKKKPRRTKWNEDEEKIEIQCQNSNDNDLNFYRQQLNSISTLIRYFSEKLSERKLSIPASPGATNSCELMSNISETFTPTEEKSVDLSETKENDTTSQSTITVAVRLPRTFASLEFQPASISEIIHSPHYQEESIEYKKELPSDIVNKYAGVSKQRIKPNQQLDLNFGKAKKNRRNNKTFAMKHSPWIIGLYNDLRSSIGNFDTLPSMPMYEYELSSTLESLKLVEDSIQMYVNETLRPTAFLSLSSRDEPENESTPDSAVDELSEISSVTEPITLKINDSTDGVHVSSVPETNSTSSNDENKTVVSCSSPVSSGHRQENIGIEHSSADLLCTVEEKSSFFISNDVTNQVQRQISDEGYRSVRNEMTQLVLIDRDTKESDERQTYNPVEKVDQWLNQSAENLASSTSNDCGKDDAPSNFAGVTNEFLATNMT